MAGWLIDTSVLLRTLHPADPQHSLARSAGAILRGRREMMCGSLQCLTEFWSVCTRPLSARGGLGLSLAETERRVKLIERTLTFLPDTDAVRAEWRRLVVAYQVRGVQVYDTRLVASMLAHGLTHLLTFNDADFRRFREITPVHPQDVVDGKA